MATPTPVHPRSGAALLTGIVVAAVVLLAAAAAGVAALLPAATAAGTGQLVLALPGGLLRVIDVQAEVLTHPPAMPAAMMRDHVPTGWRRVAVRVALQGTDRNGLRYSAADLRVTAPGAPAAAPEREGLGTGVLAAGYRLDGELVFRVPEDAAVLTLSSLSGGQLQLAVPTARLQDPHHGSGPARGRATADGGDAGHGRHSPKGTSPSPPQGADSTHDAGHAHG